MPEDLLFSCILTTHNRLRRACRAVHSVLSQTHANLELIAVDDLSADGTLDSLMRRAWLDLRFARVMTTDLPPHDQDGGRPSDVNRYAHNINLAWRRCRGDLICFLCDDAWYESSCFARVGAFAAKHPKAMAFYVPCVVHGILRSDTFMPAVQTLEMAHGVVDHSSVFVRRDLMEALGAEYGAPWDEDSRFWQCGDARFFARFTRRWPLVGIGGNDALVHDEKRSDSLQAVLWDGEAPLGTIGHPPDPYK